MYKWRLNDPFGRIEVRLHVAIQTMVQWAKCMGLTYNKLTHPTKSVESVCNQSFSPYY